MATDGKGINNIPMTAQNNGNVNRSHLEGSQNDGVTERIHGASVESPDPQERSNSKMAQMADMNMSFQMNQPYDHLAMTQQREKLPSSQLDRKPIVVAASPTNKFRVTIEQGSVDSKESAAHLHHRMMPKKPSLVMGSKTRDSGTGMILMQNSTKGFFRQQQD